MPELRTERVKDCLIQVPLAAAKKLLTQDYRPSGLYPIVDQGQTRIAGWTDDADGLITQGLPVIVFGDHTRAFKFIDFPFARGADGTQVLKPRPDIDPLFFFYALRAVDLPSRGYNRHFKALKEKEIQIPSDDEQIQIARSLKLIDDTLAVQDVELQTLDRCKRAAMQALFTDGLKGEPQKETEIGPMPESWDVVPFDAAFKIAQGQVDPKVEPYASMRHIGPENVESGTGRLLPCQTARELGLISGKYAFSRSDIVYSKIRPYLNKVALPDFDGLCSADMYPLRPTSLYERNFLFHYLLSEFFLRQATPHQMRTGIPKINREQLSSTSFPRPSIDEQQNITAILDAIDRKIDLHRRKRTVLDELFKALLHRLMTGEIRVADLDLSALAGKRAADAAA